MENMLFLALVEYYDQTVIQSKFVLLINQVPIFTQNKKKKSKMGQDIWPAIKNSIIEKFFFLFLFSLPLGLFYLFINI